MPLSEGHMAEINRLKRVAQIVAASEVHPTPINDVEGLRRILIDLQSSTSWRLTAPMRRAAHFIKNPGAGFGRDYSASSETNTERLVSEIYKLRSSTSWRVTAPLRFVKQLIARR